MKRLNLCIDIDGTVTEAYDWIPWVNEHFKTHITPEDAIVYDIHKVLGVQPQVFEAFYAQYGPKLHANAQIRQGAQRILTKLHQQHKVHFVTAREKDMETVTADWFAKHLVPYHSLSLVGSHNKVEKALALNCDLFIEDRYENAIQLAESGFDVLLMDCNYNRKTLPSNVSRIQNWLQIEALVNDLAKTPNSLVQKNFRLGLAE